MKVSREFPNFKGRSYPVVLPSNQKPYESLKSEMIIREAVQVEWYVSTKDFKI